MIVTRNISRFWWVTVWLVLFWVYRCNILHPSFPTPPTPLQLRRCVLFESVAFDTLSRKTCTRCQECLNQIHQYLGCLLPSCCSHAPFHFIFKHTRNISCFCLSTIAEIACFTNLVPRWHYFFYVDPAYLHSFFHTENKLSSICYSLRSVFQSIFNSHTHWMCQVFFTINIFLVLKRNCWKQNIDWEF